MTSFNAHFGIGVVDKHEMLDGCEFMKAGSSRDFAGALFLVTAKALFCRHYSLNYIFSDGIYGDHLCSVHWCHHWHPSWGVFDHRRRARQG